MRHLYTGVVTGDYQTDHELDFDQLLKIRELGLKVYRYRGNSYQQLDYGTKEEPKLEWKEVEEGK